MKRIATHLVMIISLASLLCSCRQTTSAWTASANTGNVVGTAAADGTAVEQEVTAGQDTFAGQPSPDKQDVPDVYCSPSQQAQSGNPKQSTVPAAKDAECAVQAFIDAAKSADFEAIMQTFAIEDYVNRYNPESEDAKYIPKPSISEREQEVAEQILSFYQGLQMAHDDLKDSENFMNSIQHPTLQELLKQGRYDSLEILRIDLPESDPLLHNQRISKGLTGMTLYGAEGWDYRSALLSFNGETYYCGFQFLLYNGAYRLESLHCPILDLSWQIVTIPCSKEEYESLLQN